MCGRGLVAEHHTFNKAHHIKWRFVNRVIVAVGKRLQEAMREEDIAARVGVAKYALVLPMTNRQKTEIVIERIRASINKLVFDTGKEKIRVSFTTGYTTPDIGSELTFDDMLDQAEDALQRAILSSTDKVVSFDDEIEVSEPPLVITEQDIQQAFAHIVEGNFYQIPEQHLDQLK